MVTITKEKEKVSKSTKSKNKVLTPKDRINKACNNYLDISNNCNNPKFEYLDSWVYKNSKVFKAENTTAISRKYPRFDFGTILKIDFGINQGSELSGPHFAISLTKYDSTKSGVITVLPLTSKPDTHDLKLNDLIVEQFTKRLDKKLDILEDLISERKITTDAQLAKCRNDIKLIKEMISFYSNYAKSSYGCINQITTISKSKIMKPKNEFDIIGRAKCGKQIMDLISNSIISTFTNINC